MTFPSFQNHSKTAFAKLLKLCDFQSLTYKQISKTVHVNEIAAFYDDVITKIGGATFQSNPCHIRKNKMPIRTDLAGKSLNTYIYLITRRIVWSYHFSAFCCLAIYLTQMFLVQHFSDIIIFTHTNKTLYISGVPKKCTDFTMSYL